MWPPISTGKETPEASKPVDIVGHPSRRYLFLPPYFKDVERLCGALCPAPARTLLPCRY